MAARQALECEEDHSNSVIKITNCRRARCAPCAGTRSPGRRSRAASSPRWPIQEQQTKRYEVGCLRSFAISATACRSGFRPSVALSNLAERRSCSSAAALGADHVAAKPRNLYVGRIARHVDQALVPAGIVEARRNQPCYAQLAPVAERHRRTGRVLGFHSMTSSARAMSVGGT